jgi:predicted nucleic acid-binding protein
VLAGDTNVVVRYLTRHDAEQFAKVIGSDNVHVCTTVVLETEWVLRRGYRFSRQRIIAALAAFAGLPRVALETLPSLPRHWIGRDTGWISPTRSLSQRHRVAKPSSASTCASLQWLMP